MSTKTSRRLTRDPAHVMFDLTSNPVQSICFKKHKLKTYKYRREESSRQNLIKRHLIFSEKESVKNKDRINAQIMNIFLDQNITRRMFIQYNISKCTSTREISEFLRNLDTNSWFDFENLDFLRLLYVCLQDHTEDNLQNILESISHIESDKRFLREKIELLFEEFYYFKNKYGYDKEIKQHEIYISACIADYKLLNIRLQSEDDMFRKENLKNMFRKIIRVEFAKTNNIIYDDIDDRIELKTVDNEKNSFLIADYFS